LCEFGHTTESFQRGKTAQFVAVLPHIWLPCRAKTRYRCRMRTSFLLSRFTGLFCLVNCAACASQSASQFPSQDELKKLAERPAANPAQPETWADVEEWELTGPLRE
jgi:hypothetical protein